MYWISFQNKKLLDTNLKDDNLVVFLFGLGGKVDLENNKPKYDKVTTGNLTMIQSLMFMQLMSEEEGNTSFDNKEYHESSFTYKVITNKLEAFNIDIKISDAIHMIIDLCSQGNPLKCQIILWKVLKNIKGLKPGHTLTGKDFMNTFPDQIPLCTIPKVEKEMHEFAKSIKIDGQYICDTEEFWNQVWED